MDENGTWKLAPAYDLTFSSGMNAEQSISVMGEGRNPKIVHLVKLGQDAKLPKKLVEEVFGQTVDDIGDWKNLATTYHVTNSNVELVASAINSNKQHK